MSGAAVAPSPGFALVDSHCHLDRIDLAPYGGDCAALLHEMKGFHWMMSYGSYLPETGYALRKLGVEFLNVST